MDNKKEARSSNIEFLRIISMLMIIASHYVIMGTMHTSYGEPYLYWAEGSAFNRLFSSFFAAGGDVGVGAFFLITGLFISGSSKRRKINGIICPVLFYAIIGIILNVAGSMLFGGGINYLGILKLGVTPVMGYNWWFATSYIALVLLAPVINEFLGNSSNKKAVLTIILLWIFWYSAGYALQLNLWGIERAVFYYIVGAYFKTNLAKIKSVKKTALVFVFVVSWLLYWVLTYMIGSVIGGLAIPDLLNHGIVVDLMKMTRAVVFAPICGITLFWLFVTIDLKYSATINKIASTTFGVYLLHEIPINRKLMWRELFKCEWAYSKNVLVIIHFVLVVIGVFVIGMLFDMFRKRFLEKRMNSLYFKIFGIEKQ